MSANVPGQGEIRQLDRIPEAPAPVTEKEVTDASWLARTLLALVREMARLRGLWRPRRIDFEGRALDATGTTLLRFQHGFGVTKVRYWIVEWSGAAAPNIRANAASDESTLVLTSTSAGTATVRVEEPGA